MLLTYQQVAQAAMQLSPDERVDLAEKLWVSVDTPETIAAAWDEEIARRVAQLDAGEAETVAAEQVRPIATAWLLMWKPSASSAIEL